MARLAETATQHVERRGIRNSKIHEEKSPKVSIQMSTHIQLRLLLLLPGFTIVMRLVRLSQYVTRAVYPMIVLGLHKHTASSGRPSAISV